ncbi:hypothetical protein OU798_00435 [Prolixibacteraceae bacterium Z1-6]|uniref:Uncharacterized protein n=1 Tax=Draconibacterium aestuarii TaxID=2998507 RepID=A0A9X3F1R6_9BACT|nr:hypothetical protein [Prolixibacteraceae bacterium Z1-6]
MSYLEDFEVWKDAIEGVLPGKVKPPNQPVDDFVAKTETLAVDAAEDREALKSAGMDENLIDELTPLSGTLRYCQAKWMSEYRARAEAQTQWKEQAPQAYALRDELLHHFSFAYRNHDDIIKKVRRIREGASHADMIQDLIELAVLGEKYPEPLTSVNLDPDLLPQARTVSHTMSELLAAANGANGEGSANKLLRDKAFTLLFEKDSTIREYGRYVFWKDEDKRSKYYK